MKLKDILKQLQEGIFAQEVESEKEVEEESDCIIDKPEKKKKRTK